MDLKNKHLIGWVSNIKGTATLLYSYFSSKWSRPSLVLALSSGDKHDQHKQKIQNWKYLCHVEYESKVVLNIFWKSCLRGLHLYISFI